MLNLLIAPRKVYRQFVSRKESKNQFARDDPAFLVLLSGFLFLSSAVMSFAFIRFGFHFFPGFFKLFLWTVFVDCISSGLLIASTLWAVMNQFFRKDLAQDVEWGYAFDIHLNAVFPFLVCIHVIQPIFFDLLLDDSLGFVGVVLANTLYLLACSYYVYITFLGYSSLAFLKNTKKILTLFPVLLTLYLVTLVLQWNISQAVMRFYSTFD